MFTTSAVKIFVPDHVSLVYLLSIFNLARFVLVTLIFDSLFVAGDFMYSDKITS